MKKVVATANNLHAYSTSVDSDVLNSVCLADFLNPTTFLNSLKQQTARSKGVSIDSLELFCDMSRSSAQSMEVINLYIQGAMSDSKALRQCKIESNDLQRIGNL